MELGGSPGSVSVRSTSDGTANTTTPIGHGAHGVSSANTLGTGGNATGERVAFFSGGDSQLYVSDVEYQVTTKLSRRNLLASLLPKRLRRWLNIAGTPQTVTVDVSNGVYFRLDAETANDLAPDGSRRVAGQPGIDGLELRQRPDPQASRQKRYLPAWLAKGRLIGHAAVEEVGDVEQVLAAIETQLRGPGGVRPPVADQVMSRLRGAATVLSTNGVRAFIDSLTNGGVSTLVVDDTPAGKRYLQVVVRAKLSNPRWNGFSDKMRVETAAESALKIETAGTRTVRNNTGWSVTSMFRLAARVIGQVYRSVLAQLGFNATLSAHTERAFTTVAATNPTTKRISIGPRKSHRFLMDVDYHVTVHTLTKPPRWSRVFTFGLVHLLLRRKDTTTLAPQHQPDGLTMLVPEGLVSATPHGADAGTPDPAPRLHLDPGPAPRPRFELPTPHNVDGVSNIADLRAAAMLALSARAELPDRARRSGHPEPTGHPAGPG